MGMYVCTCVCVCVCLQACIIMRVIIMPMMTPLSSPSPVPPANDPFYEAKTLSSTNASSHAQSTPHIHLVDTVIQFASLWQKGIIQWDSLLPWSRVYACECQLMHELVYWAAVYAIHGPGITCPAACVPHTLLCLMCQCPILPLVAVMEGGQPEVEPQSKTPRTQVPSQAPLSTGNTSSKTGASKLACVCVCVWFVCMCAFCA